jgi:hypothetical protein
VAGQLYVQPISLFDSGTVLNLNLHKPGPSQTIAQEKPSAEEDELLDGETAHDAMSGSATALGRLLSTAQAELESLAEGGIAARRNIDLVASAARRFETLGLSACARPLERCIESLSSSARLAEPSQANTAAAALLHAYYVLRLALDQEVIASACAGLR